MKAVSVILIVMVLMSVALSASAEAGNDVSKMCSNGLEQAFGSKGACISWHNADSNALPAKTCNRVLGGKKFWTVLKASTALGVKSQGDCVNLLKSLYN